ncbi:MAG: hypothetical protein Ct9H300mP16_04660 [Pseudomonadota bacterium]|nr:MAG: hypothetical protein Ct9H300mP16_04660 [Pseudomonadota bacterium]
MPEDYDLWLRLVAGGHRIASVKQEVVAIRDHPGRLTRTDPRYQRSGFDLCRRNFLQVTVLREPRKVVLWAGQRGGRPWLQWLKYSGHRVVAVLDITSAKERNRTPVLPPTALAELDLTCCWSLSAPGVRARKSAGKSPGYDRTSQKAGTGGLCYDAGSTYLFFQRLSVRPTEYSILDQRGSP